MDIKINQQNFGVTFVNTESLKETVDYALSRGKFDVLNEARKNLAKYDEDIALSVNIIPEENAVEFKRFVKVNVVGHENEPYGIYVYKTKLNSNTKNPYEFVFRRLVQMGEGAPNGDFYKNVVNRHNRDWRKYL